MKNLDIQQIADSGQIFRFNRMEDGRYELIASDKRLIVDPKEVDRAKDQDADSIFPNKFWRNFFDLGTDYGKFMKAVPKDDEFLQAAIKDVHGMRILNQDPWEMLISFIISQRKNIPAIKASVEKICERYGKDMGGYHAFPTPKELAKATLDELKDSSLGYRAPYIYECAKKVAEGEYDLEAWRDLDDEALRAQLMSIKGVGIKVANCVMLFGYHRIGAFPVDVWIQRVIDGQYDGKFPLERYQGFAGVIQQYMFFHGRNQALNK